MSIADFVKKLFSKKKKKLRPYHGLINALKSSIGLAESSSMPQRMNIDDFKKQHEKDGNAKGISALKFVLPNTNVQMALFATGADKLNTASHEGAARFAGLKLNGNDIQQEDFATIISHYKNEEELRAFYWQFDGFIISELQPQLFVAFSPAYFSNLVPIFESEARSKELIDNSADIDYSGSEDCVAASNVKEIAAARLLLPDIQKTGLKVMSSPERICRGTTNFGKSENFSVRVNCLSERGSFSLFFLFDKNKSLIKSALPGGLNLFFETSLAKVKGLLSECGINVKFSKLSEIKPGELKCGDGAGTEFRISINTKAMRCLLFLEERTLSTLNALLGDPSAELCSSSLLDDNRSAFLLLNEKLFKKHFDAYLQSITGREEAEAGGVNIAVGAGELLFCEFISLLSPSDILRVVYSFTAIGNDISGLKKYGYIKFQYNDRFVNLRRYAYDEEKVKVALPDRMRRRYESVGRTAFFKEDFAEKNIELMEKLYEEYARDRLQLSQKSLMIMKKAFLAPLNIRSGKELKLMNDKSTLSRLYERMNIETKESFLENARTKDFFRPALYGDEWIFDKLKHHISGRGIEMMKEDLEFYIRQNRKHPLFFYRLLKKKRALVSFAEKFSGELIE